MDDRFNVEISAVLIAAMFVTAAGGNWLTLLFFAAMAVIVTWETSQIGVINWDNADLVTHSSEDLNRCFRKAQS